LFRCHGGCVDRLYRAADSAPYAAAAVVEKQAPGVCTLSDHGFHGHRGTLPGYSQPTIAYVAQRNANLGKLMRELCTDHSHYRISVENMNRVLKMWGCIRGRSRRSDALRQDAWSWRTASFAKYARVVWSPTNMRGRDWFGASNNAMFQII
jgi:hypothetical protein